MVAPLNRLRTQNENIQKVFALTFDTEQETLRQSKNYALSAGRKLIEILVRIAHVRVFRFVPNLRRKFRVPCMNVRNIRRQ
jgi:hypothetical protein